VDVHASEKEQVEALKKWWKENGSSVITGLLLGAALLLGGKAWLGYRETQTLNASTVYSQMMMAQKADSVEVARNQANQLITTHPGSGYAPLAALMLASQAVKDGELEAASTQLQWAIDHAESSDVLHVARLRLIQVLIASGQHDKAAAQLAAVQQPQAWVYKYRQLEGDLAVATGDTQGAARAYRESLDSMPEQAPDRALLTAKYESVAGMTDPQE
jgi:predicted negative regulator of RcsB-dependent stress response